MPPRKKRSQGTASKDRCCWNETEKSLLLLVPGLGLVLELVLVPGKCKL